MNSGLLAWQSQTTFKIHLFKSCMPLCSIDVTWAAMRLNRQLDCLCNSWFRLTTNDMSKLCITLESKVKWSVMLNVLPQRAHDVIMTPLSRQNDVVTSFRRHNDVIIAPALPELLWLPTVWRCPYIEIAFSTLDSSIVPTCGAWCSATAAKRGPLKQYWTEIQHSRDDEPLGVLMQMRNVRVNGFFFFSSLGVLPGVLVDTLSLCSGDFCVECVLIVLHKFYIEL